MTPMRCVKKGTLVVTCFLCALCTSITFLVVLLCLVCRERAACSPQTSLTETTVVVHNPLPPPTLPPLRPAMILTELT